MLNTFLHANMLEAGVDEAGRGCYAGPVFAAAVILPASFYHPLLNDSKLVSAKNRAILRPIIETSSIAFAVAKATNIEIDDINILQASFKAMHRAIHNLLIQPQHILIDGNRFAPYKKIPHTCIIKGDSLYANIAAASILAKTYRDEYMNKLAKKFPVYNWEKNKGYGTIAHRNAISVHGLCKHHRHSFNILP